MRNKFSKKLAKSSKAFARKFKASNLSLKLNKE